MAQVNNASNVLGLGELLLDESDFGTNTRQFEEEVLGHVVETGGNMAEEYEQEMAKIQSSIFSNSDDHIQMPMPSMSSSMPDILPVEPRAVVRPSEPTISYPARGHQWSSAKPEDPTLGRMTADEMKQGRVDRVMRDIGADDVDEFDQDIENDDKTYMLQQITMLRATLEDDCVDISNVNEVSHSDTSEKINLTYKTLLLKNDSNRYCSLAEELILAGAHAMEYLFDGEKDWFGRKPDLTGWSDTVRVKMRRFRYETSTLVKDMVRDYNISSGVRIGMELIPSMFLYTRTRKITARDNLASDSAYKQAIGELNATS
jgi:hypothetical protein